VYINYRNGPNTSHCTIHCSVALRVGIATCQLHYAANTVDGLYGLCVGALVARYAALLK
jgi:hypothetical protein